MIDCGRKNNGKNVAFLSFDGNENGGGVQRVSYLLATGFTERGFKSYLIYNKVLRNPSSFYAGKISYAGSHDNSKLEEFIIRNNIGYVINNCVVSSVYTGGEIRKILDTCGCKLISIIHAKPDLIKATPSIYSLYWSMKTSGSLIGKFSNILKILFFPIYKSSSNKKYIEWRKNIYNNSDRVVVLSKYYIKNICDMLHVDSEKIRSIPNPLTFDCDFPEAEIDSKKKEVLIVARLEEASKGLSRVFKAWKIVEQENQNLDWQLSIVGSGPDESYYKKLCSLYGLKHVKFYGHQKPFEYYKRASIFLMASFHEGFPMTVLEAEQMGLAIIAINNFESLGELVIDGKNGILVEDNIEKFAHSIQKLIASPELYREYGLQSVEHSKQFKLNLIMDKWLELINELANG